MDIGASLELGSWCLELSLANVLELLHSAVIRIGHKNIVVARDGDSVGEPELAGLGDVFANGEQKPTFGIEYLEVIEGGIHCVHTAFSIYRDSLGPTKVPGRIAELADLSLVSAVGRKNLHTTIHG